MTSEAMPLDRRRMLEHATRLEWLTVGWNIVEGIVAITAAIAAGSVALLGFGIDSFVETLSGTILLWRLTKERRGANTVEVREIEERARKGVAISLVLLALWIVFDAGKALWLREAPETSFVGIALTSISIVVMYWLARAKMQAAHRLESRALEADSFQTSACFWLSVITLSGVGLNAIFGWWWADPVAALGMVYFLGREAKEAWRGDECCGAQIS